MYKCLGQMLSICIHKKIGIRRSVKSWISWTLLTMSSNLATGRFIEVFDSFKDLNITKF
jgi:hypothetical protein